MLTPTLTFRSFTPFNRGAPRKGKKKADRRARACLVFPILWTLDPLSLGFNFYSLPPPLLSPPVSPYSSRVFLLRGSSHSSFPVVVDLPALFRHDARGDNAASSSFVGRGGAQCDSNQELRPCQRAISARLTIISSLFLIFSSFFPSFLFSTHRTRSFNKNRLLWTSRLRGPLIMRTDDEGKRDNSRETYDELRDIDNLFTITP